MGNKLYIKKLIIGNCKHCPNYSQVHNDCDIMNERKYDYGILNKYEIGSGIKIPEWCPLEDNNTSKDFKKLFKDVVDFDLDIFARFITSNNNTDIDIDWNLACKKFEEDPIGWIKLSYDVIDIIEGDY